MGDRKNVMLVIGHHFDKGMFSQILGWTIQALPLIDKICNEKKIKAVFNLTSQIYGEYPTFSIIPQLLIPKYNNEGGRVVQKYCIKKYHFNYIESRNDKYDNKYCSYKDNFKLANDMFNKYFTIAPKIIDQVNNFISKHFTTKILGIHYRGTDKSVNKSFGIKRDAVTVQIMFSVIDDWLTENKVDKIFLCTDQSNVIKQFKNRYNNILIFDQQLSNGETRRGFHIQRLDKIINCLKNNDEKEIKNISDCNVKLAQNALIDTLLLSKCSTVIKTQSQLSAWAKIFTPDLPVYRVGGLHKLYWPDIYIPLYEPYSVTLSNILKKVNKHELSSLIKNIPINYT